MAPGAAPDCLLSIALRTSALAGVSPGRAGELCRATLKRMHRGYDMNRPHFEGWHLLGAFPDDAPDDVGSWLLVNNEEAMLLEVPPGLTAKIVESALDRAGATLRFVTASHDHYDHLDVEAWDGLFAAFEGATFIHPRAIARHHDLMLRVGGEPVWLIKAPKHSASDVVTVFRGVAMTGDIETGMLASVNKEVPLPTKRKSMDWLREFPERSGYHVHSTVSAHLNSVRRSVRWPDLFKCEQD